MLSGDEAQIIKPPGKFSFQLKELWSYRELFYYFSWRDIKVKYKQTLLGIAWAIIQPVLIMLIFIVFFSKTLSIPTDGIPPALFYFSGLLLWNLFSNGITGAGNSIINNADILKKIYFPRLIIPVSSVFVALFDFVIAFVLFVIILFYYDLNGIDIDYFRFLFLFSMGLMITLITTLGLGCLIASFTIKYRDFKYIIPFLLQLLFFISPVIYPLSILSDPTWKYVLSFNPITSAIELARHIFLEDPLNWSLLSISIFSALMIFFIGVFNFKKTENYIADFV